MSAKQEDTSRTENEVKLQNKEKRHGQTSTIDRPKQWLTDAGFSEGGPLVDNDSRRVTTWN